MLETLTNLYESQTEKRPEAWRRFLQTKLPTTKQEAYRYVRLKDLYQSAFALSQPTTIEHTPAFGEIVMVNGQFCPELSSIPDGVIALPLSEALKTYAHFLAPRIEKQIAEEKDPFALLAHTFATEGLFLYIPPNRQIDTPLTITHRVHGDQTLIFPRIHLFVGKQSELNVALPTETSAKDVCINRMVDIALEERAILRLSELSDLESGHQFDAFRATMKRESWLESHSVTKGAITSRQDYHVKLLGEAAEASLSGLWKLEQTHQHHVHIKMEHVAPHCRSLQSFRGVLFDTARSSFEGQIYVHPEAQKTDAYQMNNNLVLGKRAVANSKPNLKILADDVKASHGATVGQLDKEQLFYLQSRGISKDEAQKVLIQGFIAEILDAIPSKTIRESAHAYLS